MPLHTLQTGRQETTINVRALLGKLNADIALVHVPRGPVYVG